MIDLLLLLGVALCVISVLMAVVAVARTQAPAPAPAQPSRPGQAGARDLARLEELLAKSANATLPASRDVGPKRIAGGLLAISVGATVLAALAAFGVVRLRAKLRRKRKARH